MASLSHPNPYIEDRWADAYRFTPRTNDGRAVAAEKQLRRIQRRDESRMTWMEKCTRAINAWRAERNMEVNS
jgi:hypothetical protein